MHALLITIIPREAGGDVPRMTTMMQEVQQEEQQWCIIDIIVVIVIIIIIIIIKKASIALVRSCECGIPVQAGHRPASRPPSTQCSASHAPLPR
jgi:hypothetical protein